MNTNTLMGHPTKGTGRTINNMELGLRLGRTDPHIKVNTRQAINMGRDASFGPILLNTPGTSF